MNLFISSCFSLLLVFVINVLCYQEESDGYHYQKAYPQDVMVDVINNFGLHLLKAHNEGNNNNMALSPYGATSVLIALGEGVRGFAVEEIQHAVHIPQDISVVRIGLRDIHRHLKSYFIPKEGFLAGLTLSNEKVPLNEEYKEILRFYGFDLDSFNNPLYPDINEVTTSGVVFMGNATEGVMTTTGYTTTFLPTETTTMVGEGVSILSSTLTTTLTPLGSTIIPEGTTQEGTTTEKSTTKVYTRSTDAVSKVMVEDEVSTLSISTQSSIETTLPPMMATEDSTMKELTDSQTIQVITEGLSSTISTTTSKVTQESTDTPITTQLGSTSSPEREVETTSTKLTTIQATTEGLSSSISTTDVSTSKVIKESSDNPTTTQLGSTNSPGNEVETTKTKLTTSQATTEGLSSSISTTDVSTSKVMKESTDSPITTQLGSTSSPESDVDTTKIELTTIQATTEGLSSSIRTTDVSTSKVMEESSDNPTTTQLGSTNSPGNEVETTSTKLTTIQATTEGSSSSISTTEEITTSKVMKASTGSPTNTALGSINSLDKQVETTTTKPTTIQSITEGSSSSISTTEDVTTSKATTGLLTTENLSSIGTDTSTTSSIPSITGEIEDMSITSSSESSSDSSSASSSSSSSDDVIITTSVTQSVTRVTTEYQTSTSEDKVTSTVQTTELDDSSDLIAISTEATSNEVVDFLTSTITPDTTTIASTEVPENTTVASSKRKRLSRSVIDYIIARYYDNQLIGNPKINYEPNDSLSFLMYGKIKEPNINFMTYDAVLPIAFIPVLNSVALSFPLDSKEYYLLLILPVEETGIDRLIHDMSHTTSLREVITALRYAHVRAVIPSFMLKGYVILTPTLQKLGIQRIFEPRQTDFSLMTREKDVYVTNVEQAVTVTIRNYVEPDNLPNYRNLQRAPPVEFKADHPFLYFVMDTEIHVTLMAGKIVNPLNSRIR